MRNRSWLFLGAVAVAAVCGVSLVQPAFAISADLAKQCRELAIKAHPPVMAGARGGTGQAERDYFQGCVARGGSEPNGNNKDNASGVPEKPH
jgi:hypothetical protein